MIKSLRSIYTRVDQSLQKVRLSISDDTTVLIVMYHAISPPPPDKVGPWKYAVSPSVFQEQIEFISKKYKVVTLDEAINWTDSTEDLAVITFDDGYEDNLTNALPVLEEYGVPATVYVSTDFINESLPYEFIVANSIVERDSIDMTVSGERICYNLNTQAQRKKAFVKLKQLAKNSWEARQDLKEEFQTQNIGLSMLNAKEIKRLDKHPLITVGAHGHRHIPLSLLSGRRLECEIQTCTSILEEVLGHSVSHFSYPYGSNSAEVRQTVQDAGYETAVTTSSSYIRLQNITSQPFELPRVDGSSKRFK